MDKFSEKIVNIIKSDKIKPQSRLWVVIKKIAIWFVIVILGLVGSISFSLLLVNLIGVDGELLRRLGVGKFIFIFFRTFPFLWLLIFLFSVFFGWLTFKKTDKGYRYDALFVTSTLVLVVLGLSFIFHLLKLNQLMAAPFQERVPFFRAYHRDRFDHWVRPEKGIIAGEILQIEKESFLIKGRGGKVWNVRINDKTKIEFIPNEQNSLSKGDNVLVIGQSLQFDSIEAFLIRKFPRFIPTEDSFGGRK